MKSPQAVRSLGQARDRQAHGRGAWLDVARRRQGRPLDDARGKQAVRRARRRQDGSTWLAAGLEIPSFRGRGPFDWAQGRLGARAER